MIWALLIRPSSAHCRSQTVFDRPLEVEEWGRTNQSNFVSDANSALQFP